MDKRIGYYSSKRRFNSNVKEYRALSERRTSLISQPGKTPAIHAEIKKLGDRINELLNYI